jgi:DNA polymerase alpha-associated DNA helicase A
MVFPSQELYDKQLVAHESVASRTLADLPELAASPSDKDLDDGLLTEPVIFYDTAGSAMYERAEDTDSDGSLRTVDGESKSNENEAEIVMKFIDEIVGSILNPHAEGTLLNFLDVIASRSQLVYLSPAYLSFHLTTLKLLSFLLSSGRNTLLIL